MTDSLHVLFSDEGHPVAIRKWSKEPFDDAVEYVRKSDYADLIAACDKALDWADANARWFDISTAPTKNGVGFHAISYDCEGVLAYHVIRHEDEYFFVDFDPCDITEFSHWRPLPPPPSNPPLPAPIERLGEVLRRVKNV